MAVYGIAERHLMEMTKHEIMTKPERAALVGVVTLIRRSPSIAEAFAKASPFELLSSFDIRISSFSRL